MPSRVRAWWLRAGAIPGSELGGHALGISCRANFLKRAHTGRMMSSRAPGLLVFVQLVPSLKHPHWQAPSLPGLIRGRGKVPPLLVWCACVRVCV